MTTVARVTVGASAALVRRPLATADRVFAAINAAVGVPLRPAGQTAAGVGGTPGLTAPVRRSAGRPRVRLSAGWVIALLASALSIAAYAYYSSQGLTLAYGDAISHMMIARRVVAGRTPGLAQLGTTWLPFNHALMLPFIWSDFLFRSGFAGSFPSMIAYVVGTVYMYRLGVLAFFSAGAGWVAAAAFALNPNTLYMQSTAMSELDLLALAVIAVYYTARWAQSFQPADLVKAAAAALAGTLVRYDGWALAIALACIILYIAWRKRGRPFAESNLILFGTLAFAGCAAWLLYNQIIFGDALAFLGGIYSSQAMQMILAADGGLPTLHNPLLSLHVYTQATVDTNGLPLVLAALGGVFLWGFRERFTLRALPLYALLVPFAFNWLSLVMGNSALDTPEIPVHGIVTYYNVRYGLMMIPAVALFFAYLAHQRRTLIPTGLALLVAFGLVSTFLSVPYVLQGPLHGVEHTPWYLPAGTWLHDHYHGGNILISYAALAPTIYYANVPDNDFITDSNEAQFKAALAHPNQWAAWVVMSKDTPADLVSVTLEQRDDWRQYYVLSKTFGPVEIYQRSDTLIGPAIDTPIPISTPTSGSVSWRHPARRPFPGQRR